MKKIMFSDKYGLTQAVLEGRKTMTRRIVPELKGEQDCELTEWGLDNKGKAMISLVLDKNPFGNNYLDIYPHFQPGEVVAVAQSYKEIGLLPLIGDNEAGWTNKMFVAADLMPHRIRITDVRVERLQDISNEDCEREGLQWITRSPGIYKRWTFKGVARDWPSRREAFAALIDNVSGKGTWESNPWVFVYEFELVK